MKYMLYALNLTSLRHNLTPHPYVTSMLLTHSCTALGGVPLGVGQPLQGPYPVGGGGQGEEEEEAVEVYDPFKPLDMHSKGNLPIKPMQVSVFVCVGGRGLGGGGYVCVLCGCVLWVWGCNARCIYEAVEVCEPVLSFRAQTSTARATCQSSQSRWAGDAPFVCQQSNPSSIVKCKTW